jgi:hypothetical protein
MELNDERIKAAEHLGTVSKEQWRLFFLACDAAQAVTAGVMQGGDLISESPQQVRQMPYFLLADEWSAWITAFYQQEIVTDIAWTQIVEIQEPQWRPRDAPEALVALVLYVRRDRFVDGAFASNVHNGDVQFAIAKLAEEYRPNHTD